MSQPPCGDSGQVPRFPVKAFVAFLPSPIPSLLLSLLLPRYNFVFVARAQSWHFFFFTLARFAAVINTHFLSPCPALPVLRSGIKPDICLRNAFQYASDCFMCGTYPAQSRTAVTWPVLTGPVYRGRGRESTKRDFTTRDSTTREFTKREYNNHDFTNRECPDHGDRSSSSWCES